MDDLDRQICTLALKKGFIRKADIRVCRKLLRHHEKRGRHPHLYQLLAVERELSGPLLQILLDELDLAVYECPQCHFRGPN